MRRRLLAIPPIAALLLLLAAGPAAAHVEVEAEEAVAGTTTTLTFSFHHGKDGTATTGLEVLMPEGTEILDVPEVEGFTSEVDEAEGTVTWTGGSVPDGEDGIFPVQVKLPDTPGLVLFKTIQMTEAGELAWIEEEEGHEEGSYPAPRLDLAPNPNPTTSTIVAPEDEPDDESEDEESTTTTERRLPGTTLEAEERDSGDNSAAPWFIGSGIAALVAIGVGGWWLKTRSG